MINKDINTISFEEVQNIFDNFFKENSELKNKLFQKIPNLETLINIMLGNLKYAFENPEDPIEEKTLLQGDVKRLTYLNYILPILYLQDSYPELDDFIKAYILTITNYKKLYAEILDEEEFNESIDSVIKLVKIEANFERLIFTTNLILERYENLITNNPEALRISRLYLQNLLNDKKEDTL